MAKMCLQDQRTIIGSNLHVIAIHLDVPKSSVMGRHLKLKQIQTDCDMIPLILELIDFRNGDAVISGCTSDDIDFMMDFICTM